MKNRQSHLVKIYDTTLRDGAQQRSITLTVDDKLRCTQLLSSFGVHYIEGGWPGSNPKDAEFFERVKDVDLGEAKLAAFGSTRRKDCSVENDPQVETLLAAATSVITLVGKSSLFQVTELIRTGAEENCRMIADTVALCRSEGREVIFDAEHFFDGYQEDSEYALSCLEAAVAAGASTLVLCDTNGGTFPTRLQQIVKTVVARFSCEIGIHTHNDSEMAVANSLLAIEAGARHVQGTINGYGERCGNANLVSIIPGILFKLDMSCGESIQPNRLSWLSKVVAELVNENRNSSQPYVGRSAFAHKGGLHIAAVERFPESYEHIPPETVGNTREIVVSELSGRGTTSIISKRCWSRR